MSMYTVKDTSEQAKEYIAKSITKAFKVGLKPPPKLNLVEWADKYRVLPDNSAEPGRWKTSRVEVAREPMLSVSNPRVQEITIMSCIQLLKALAVDTPMLTTSGWKTMGTLRVGDKIYGSNGEPCEILRKSDVKYGNQVFDVEFSDGAVITADAGHKWQVDDSRDRSTTVCTRVVNTLEISKTFKSKVGNRYAIPVAKPLNLPEQSLTIDPYVLGCWLGDGHSYSAGFTSSKLDADIVKEIQRRGYICWPTKKSVSSGDNTAQYNIQKLNPFDECAYGHKLETKKHCGKCASMASDLKHLERVNKKFFRLLKEKSLITNKHIPEEYLLGSLTQRWDLLAGLMDTDGTICKKGNCSFTQKSKTIMDGFLRLCWSLGLKPRLRKNHPDAFTATFTAYADQPIFKLTRKTNRLRSRSTPGLRVSETTRRRIVNVKKVKPVPVQCIAVDSPDHLYLAGHELIATHNTELLLNLALFHIHQEPSPLMYVAEKSAMAEAWSKERFMKSINAMPELKELFNTNRRGEGNTILQKQFPGGNISIVSARNPGDLAMRAVRVILFDEVDKYPINTGAGEAGSGGEGDPIAISWGRATTYGSRAKKITACSPTTQNRSRIEAEYLKSDQRRFYQACPHCDFAKPLVWADVNIPRNKDKKFDHTKAAIVCSSCGSTWNESDRMKSIRDGFWKADKPEITWHHGYHVSSLASPFTPISKLAREFVDALDNSESLKTFYNTRMALTWKEAGDQPDYMVLYNRREKYEIGKVPKGALVITVGIDVQKDYLVYEVVGWGRRRQSWSIEKGVIPGDIELDETKDRLYKFIETEFVNESKIRMPISKVCIDSGYNTNEVYTTCRLFPGLPDILVPVKGDGSTSVKTVLGTPRPVDLTIDGRRIHRGIMNWMVGSSVIKEQFYRWLNLEKSKNSEDYPTGYCHFPAYDEEFFKQITAEQMTLKVDKKGFHSYIWEKTRKDNHFLDCRVYARAAFSMLQGDRLNEGDWAALYERWHPVAEVIEMPVVERKPEEKTKKRKSGWVKRQ